MYAIYCSNYDAAEMLLQHKRKKKEFEQQLSVSRGTTLSKIKMGPPVHIPAGWARSRIQSKAALYTFIAGAFYCYSTSRVKTKT